ncbi:hypothetical protein TSUD_350410 [Trifolium subterraneum]|nr:hypothetical protein TSUD_350410 [Trifolium subterraneum]
MSNEGDSSDEIVLEEDNEQEELNYVKLCLTGRFLSDDVDSPAVSHREVLVRQASRAEYNER